MKYTKTFVKLRDKAIKIFVKTGLDRYAAKLSAKYFNRSYHKRFYKEMEKRRNGKIDDRYIKLKQVQGIHEGERCFIVCNGPSLKIDDLNTLHQSGEFTFGLNSIFKLFDKTDWRPDYYVCIDKCPYNELVSDPNFELVKNKFLPDYFFLDSSFPDDCFVFPLEYYEVGIYGWQRHFSDDIYVVAYGATTVTSLAMQIAAYMGFKEIYLIGCDNNFSVKNNTNHAEGIEYKKVLKAAKNAVERNEKGYETARKHCEERGIKIYNATRGGKLEVFPRVDFDSLFEEDIDNDKKADQ